MWSILFRYFINSLKIVLSNGVQTSYVPVQVSLKLLFIETIIKQFTAILVADQALVEVVICSSVTTLIPIKYHAPTLATHTNLQQDTSTTLHKPTPFLLEVLTLHPMKLKYFIK